MRRRLDEREQGRGPDRHDLVIIAMQDQGRNVEGLKILGEVRLGEGLDAIKHSFEPGLHPLKPERIPQTLRNQGVGPVGAVEGGW